jgi:hypothetical protein
MSIEVVPFEAGLGAEIRGVDIRELLSPQEGDEVRARHGIQRERERTTDLMTPGERPEISAILRS